MSNIEFKVKVEIRGIEFELTMEEVRVLRDALRIDDTPSYSTCWRSPDSIYRPHWTYYSWGRCGQDSEEIDFMVATQAWYTAGRVS